jgi:hypothetical protein
MKSMQLGSLSDSAAKPKGKLGAEIWRYVGNALPAGEADFQFDHARYGNALRRLLHDG